MSARVPDNLATRFYDNAFKVFRASDVKDRSVQDAAKIALMVLWRCIHPDTRRSFIDCLGDDLMPRPKVDRTKEREELEVITMLRGWPSVLGSVSKDQMGFAKSIMKQRSNESWYPSKKQIPLMRALWAERQVSADEPELME